MSTALGLRLCLRLRLSWLKQPRTPWQISMFCVPRWKRELSFTIAHRSFSNAVSIYMPDLETVRRWRTWRGWGQGLLKGSAHLLRACQKEAYSPQKPLLQDEILRAGNALLLGRRTLARSNYLLVVSTPARHRRITKFVCLELNNLRRVVPFHIPDWLQQQCSVVAKRFTPLRSIRKLRKTNPLNF